jgi:GDPmannose 4,6-dehydratase
MNDAGKKVALITGITGQDGSYLAELLLEKGYEVHGLVRRSSTFNTARIDHLFIDPHESGVRLYLHHGDVTDPISLSGLIEKIKPTEIYNLAAQSHVLVSFSMPSYTNDVNAGGTLSILEAIRSSGRPIRFYQASTSEMFGSTPPPQNLNSIFAPRSPYAASKLYAYWVTKNYREAYQIFAVNGILFNHESPRRGETFVTRKISLGINQIMLGNRKSIYLGNLDSIRDWGYAKEYVYSMWLMLQQEVPRDYVVGTGVGATVRDFCEAAFSQVGLDYEKYVKFDERYMRPTEVEQLICDNSMTEVQLAWKPETTWRELAKIMVNADTLKSQPTT